MRRKRRRRGRERGCRAHGVRQSHGRGRASNGRGSVEVGIAVLAKSVGERTDESEPTRERFPAIPCALHLGQGRPRNHPQERLLAIIVVLIALVTFSTFLGRMTSAMSQLISLHAERNQHEVKLRQFVCDNKIPKASDLSRRGSFKGLLAGEDRTRPAPIKRLRRVRLRACSASCGSYFDSVLGHA